MDECALMVTLIAFLVTLGILVTVHEYGHFQMARWCGVKVLRFSVGFGKPLFSRRLGKDQTEFILAALPLGGYVKMLDEREGPVENPADLPYAFNRQSVWKRIAIVSAGPSANLLLAILLYWILFMHGVVGMKPILGEITPGSPAAQASMKSGELLKKVAGEPVNTWQDVRWILLQQSLKTPSVEIEAVNDGNELHLHRLALNSIGKEDYEGDFLDKLGLKPFQPEVPAKVGEIVAGSAAEKAGLKVGDEVLRINGIEIKRWEELVNTVREHPEQQLVMNVQRNGSNLDLPITPEVAEENGQRIGRIGAVYRMEQAELDKLMVTTPFGVLPALSMAATKTWETSIFSLKMLGKMLIGDVSWKGISGPVTIASYAGQSANIGWKAFLGFLALISISLGVLNLLPIPVLDGGHLLYYMIEIFKGSPVSEAFMETGQRVGLALLGLLMVVAFYNDFNRFITG
jgi:regulator of sigma E protease